MNIAIFLIGSLVFALTVYGAVMVGGLILTREQLDQDDALDPGDDASVELPGGIPVDVEY